MPIEKEEKLAFSTAIYSGAEKAFEFVTETYANPENLWILCPQYSNSHGLEDFQVFVTGTPDASSEEIRTVVQRELAEELGIYVSNRVPTFIVSRDLSQSRSRVKPLVSTFVTNAKNVTVFNTNYQFELIYHKKPQPDKSRKIQCLVVGTRDEIFSLIGKISDKLDSSDTHPSAHGSWISGVRAVPFHFAVINSMMQLRTVIEAEEKAKMRLEIEEKARLRAKAEARAEANFVKRR